MPPSEVYWKYVVVSSVRMVWYWLLSATRHVAGISGEERNIWSALLDQYVWNTDVSRGYGFVVDVIQGYWPTPDRFSSNAL
jgi:hypothetical protein